MSGQHSQVSQREEPAMSIETDERYAQLADPPLPGGRPRTYLGSTGAAVVIVLFLLFTIFIVGYTCSTALGI
jgi:hypothetical protein